MIDILNKYLIQHNHINIPGLGTLYLERIPAIADVGTNKILPPYYTLRFDKYFDAPDKTFFTYLASQEKIPDYEAIKQYNQFAQDLRSQIKLEEKAEWKEMGTFRKDDSGDVVFEPVSDLLHPYEPVLVEPARIDTEIPAPAEALATLPEEAISEIPVLPNTTRRVRYMVTGRWWVYALVLAAIGLIVLFYQVSRYGGFWEAIVNHQPLP